MLARSGVKAVHLGVMFDSYYGDMKSSKAATTGFFAAVFALSAAVAIAYPGAQFAKKATVTIAQARAIALRTVHGKIVAQELEPEKGGSGLRYSFDIKMGSKTIEVGVDAKTGKVLQDIAEGSKPD